MRRRRSRRRKTTMVVIEVDKDEATKSLQAIGSAIGISTRE